jgi:hypothetical protein
MGKKAKPDLLEMMDAVIHKDEQYIRENIDPDTRAVYDAVMELYQMEQDQYGRDEARAAACDEDGQNQSERSR